MQHQIIFKQLNGNSIYINVDMNTTIYDVKKIVSEKINHNIEDISIINNECVNNDYFFSSSSKLPNEMLVINDPHYKSLLVCSIGGHIVINKIGRAHV